DDVRWYLSHYLVQKIQSLLFDPNEVVRYIWSGEMEGFLYNMEENFLNDLEDQHHRNIIDETNIRSTFQEILVLKKKRQELR
ncbi:MAG: hypothetical protein PF447_09310, partial [Spirochaetaceae bacterium]|nr:hypothetical protein [Spirochaetaceae bacterium]